MRVLNTAKRDEIAMAINAALRITDAEAERFARALKVLEDWEPFTRSDDGQEDRV